jgi:hypothetical protein
MLLPGVKSDKGVRDGFRVKIAALFNLGVPLNEEATLVLVAVRFAGDGVRCVPGRAAPGYPCTDGEERQGGM